MEPALTLLAGYWIFRGLEALIRSDEQEKASERAQQQKLEIDRLNAALSQAQKPLVIPTLGGRSLRAPTAARYTDAKSLFGAEYVSFTRLSTFEKCPKKFKLTYLEGYRQEDRDQSRQAKSGGDFHAICEDLFKRYQNRPLGRALEDPVVRKEPRIRKVLDAAPADSQILASELELRFRARGREFLGYVDLALELPDSTVGLIDFKTGYRDQRFPPDPIQMDIYSMPELLLRPTRSVRLAFVLVDADRTDAWTNGPENRDVVIERVRKRIVAVERETMFPPNPSGLCQYCHVRDMCEAGGGGTVYKQFANRQQLDGR
jgi:RecB family exonuclease